MFNRILKLILASALMFNSVGAFAQALEPLHAPVFHVIPDIMSLAAGEQAPPPLGSAPLEEDFVETVPYPPIIETVPQTPAQPSPVAVSQIERAERRLSAEEYFSDPERRTNFKLFEPSRYGFLQDEDATLLLPQTPALQDDDLDNYYRYSRAYLENAIKDIDGAIELRERGIEYLEILNPSLLVPIYGTTISLTGRKTFGLNFAAKKYKGKRTVNNPSYSGVDFRQEMQVKLQGKISDRIFVDIDYDDQREDEQNISIAYRGKPGEFVQSADFGDIELSLPNTEFLSYNKQVFGAKMHLQYGGANLRVIGSQTKGTSRSRQFRGDNVFDTVNIRDIQYIRQRYYDLTFDSNPMWTRAIVPGSEKVYLDDHTNQGYQVVMRAEDLIAVPPVVYPQNGADGSFKLLTRGVDYVIDYNRNILIFNIPLNDTDVVAVDYENTLGDKLTNVGLGYPKIIKTPGNRPIETPDEIGYQLEIKRFYNIGAQQISRDNGRGNFILRLLESDGREACPSSLSPVPDYCTFIMDFDKGIFEILGPFPDLGIYAPTPVSAANRYFFVQFSSAVRTYFLEPDIVVQSELVKINGATMARNRDYYVDYASGFITFYKEELIGPGSIIDVTYEVSAGGSGETSLLGGRFNYDFTRNISVGASLINEGGTQPKRVPNVGSLTSNLMVMEADFKAKDVEIMDGVKLSLGVEAAQSRKDENLFGYAMIDNLEETKEYVKASPNFSDWVISSNPNNKTSFLDAITWDTQEIKVLDINPSSAARIDSKQNVLVINYDFTIADDWGGDPLNDEISIVLPLSPHGVDFTNKTLFELTMQGEVNGPLMNITFGTVDERSDNYMAPLPPGLTEADIFPVCSKYYSPPPNYFVPKTEDLRCTGELTPAEDVGWWFVNPDGTYQRYDPFRNNIYNRLPQPNGRIDTQDLNGNGLYDVEDPTAGGSFGFNGELIAGMPGNIINFSDWRQFQQEFDFSDRLQWGAIRQVRITLKKNPALGSSLKGTIRIANLSVSGSTWQPLDNASSAALVAYGINNIDNPTVYKPIFSDTGDGGQVFRTLYGSVSGMVIDAGTNNIREQSLAIDYDFGAAAGEWDLNVQHNFSRMDFSQHKEFRFLLYNNGAIDDPPPRFYLRVSTDDSNYSEIEIPLDFNGEWRLYSLKLIDTTGAGTPTRWEDNSKYPLPPGAVKNEGFLHFKRISTIKAGVRAYDALGMPDTASIAKGEVWLNEIFLADSIVRVGNAYMAEAAIDIDNWLEAGGKYTYMDDNFQTPLAVPAKQKNTKEDYYMKLKKIQNLPITANYYRSNTITPDVLDYDRSNTVSIIDGGEVSRDGGTARADYINPLAPRIGLEYTFENASYEKLERNDSRRYYGATLDYSPRTTEPLFKNIIAGASYNNNKINYSDARAISAPSNYYDIDERTQNYNIKLMLQPWRGASIIPSYNLATVDERRRYYDDFEHRFKEKHYDKSASQSAGINAALRITKWLAPTAGYTITTRENNNLSDFTYRALDQDYFFNVGDVKTVNRMSDGNIALTLNGREMLPGYKLFAGLTISGAYKMQDGDSWENVDSSFTSLDELWIRSSMGLNAPYTYRRNLTLRDTYTAALRWTPLQQYALQGWKAPLKTLSIMNNFTRSFQTTEDLGSSYDTQTTTLPDAVVFIDELDKIWGGGIVKSTNLKLKYNETNTRIIGLDEKKDISYGGDLRFILFNYFDNTVSYTEHKMDKGDARLRRPLESYLRRDISAQSSFNYKRVRFTPKFTYLFDTRSQTDGVLVNDVKEMVPSLNIRADFNLPSGLRLPFLTRQYLMTNRVIWNTNISYSQRRSFTVSENRDLLDINTNFDYELSKNIRFTVTGACQIFNHKYIEEESYTAYSLGTLMTIQF